MIDSSAELDPAHLVASVLRRAQHSELVDPERLPFVGAVLAAALVGRVDTLAWLDGVGVPSDHLVSMVEVLFDGQFGTAVDLIASIFTPDGADPGVGNGGYEGAADGASNTQP